MLYNAHLRGTTIMKGESRVEAHAHYYKPLNPEDSWLNASPPPQQAIFEFPPSELSLLSAC